MRLRKRNEGREIRPSRRLVGRLAWILLTIGLLSGSLRARADLVINTDALTINGSRLSFNNTAMFIQASNGIARFFVLGDITIPANTQVTIVGSRPLSLVAANNVMIGANVTFDVS